MNNDLSIVIAEGLTSKQVRFINALIVNRCNVSKACESIGISRQTYYRWSNESDSFTEALLVSKEALMDMWEDEIHKHVFDDRNPVVLNRFAPMVLKDRGYGEAKDLNVLSNNTNDNNVIVTVIDATTAQDNNEEEQEIE